MSEAWRRLLDDPTDMRARATLVTEADPHTMTRGTRVELEVLRQGASPIEMPSSASWWPVASTVAPMPELPCLVLDGKTDERSRPILLSCPGGDVLAVVADEWGSVAVWDARAGWLRHHLLVSLGASGAALVAAGSSASVARIATSHVWDRFRLWDAASGDEVPTDIAVQADAIAFSARSGSDEIRVVTATPDMVALWDAADGRLLGQTAHDWDYVDRIAAAPGRDGSVAFALMRRGSDEIEWSVWGSRHMRWVAGNQAVFGMARDGRLRMATAFNSTDADGWSASTEVTIWDVDSATPVSEPIVHVPGITALTTASLEGHEVLATSTGTHLRMLDLETGRQLGELETGPLVFGLASGSDAPLLVAARLDTSALAGVQGADAERAFQALRGMLHLWDGGDRHEALDLGLRGSAAHVSHLAVAEIDGTTVALTCVGDDRPLRLWNLAALREPIRTRESTPVETVEQPSLGELDGRIVKAVVVERPDRSPLIRAVDVSDGSFVGRRIFTPDPSWSTAKVGFASTVDGRSILLALKGNELIALDRLVPPEKGPIRAATVMTPPETTGFVPLEAVHHDTVRVGLRSDAGTDVIDMRLSNGSPPTEAITRHAQAGSPTPTSPTAALPERWLVGKPSGWLWDDRVDGYSTGSAYFCLTFAAEGLFRRAPSIDPAIEHVRDKSYRVRGRLSSSGIDCGGLLLRKRIDLSDPSPLEGSMVEGVLDLWIGWEESNVGKRWWVIDKVRESVVECRLDPQRAS